MMGTFRDFLDLFHLLAEASARGATGAAKVLAGGANTAGRALKRVFRVSVVLFVVIPGILFGIGIFGGGQGYFTVAGLLFGVGAGVLALTFTSLGVVVAAVLSVEESRVRWYLKVSVSLLVAALFCCLLLQVIPWERNPIMMPVVLVAAVILALTNAWLYSPRFITSLTSLLLLGAVASIFFPTAATNVGRAIDRTVNRSFATGPDRVQVTCDDIMAGTVRFFSDAGPEFWVHRDEEGSTEFFSQPGRHPAYNVALSPVTEDDVQREFQLCEEERQRAQEAAEAATRLRDSTTAAEAAAVAEARAASAAEQQRRAQAEAERIRLAAQAEAETAAERERRAREMAESIAADAEGNFLSARESVEAGPWETDTRWRQELLGKSVSLYYSVGTASLAGEFAGRLERLGARVQPMYGNPSEIVTSTFEVYYRQDDLGAATAIQAATVDLRRLDLTSDRRMIDLAIWFR